MPMRATTLSRSVRRFNRVGGFDLVGLVVHHHQLDGTVKHGGHLFVRELDTFQFQLSAKGVLTGQRQIHADFDRFRGHSLTGKAERQGQHGQSSETFAQLHR